MLADNHGRNNTELGAPGAVPFVGRRRVYTGRKKALNPRIHRGESYRDTSSMFTLLLRPARYVTLGLVTFVAASGIALARAGGGPADTTDLKTITADRSVSPMGCIGSTSTPLCAVATAAACDIWTDPGLCRAVGHRPPYELTSHEDYWRLYVFQYKPVAEHVLGHVDIPEWATELGDASWRPGDLAYDVWFRECRPSNPCVLATEGDPRLVRGEGCPADACEWEVNPRTYILRQGRQGWRVVYIYIPQWHLRDAWIPTWRFTPSGR